MNDESEHTKRSWFNLTNILIAVVLLFLLIITIWNQTISEKLFIEQDLEGLITATPTESNTAIPPIPSEFYSDPSDTFGIIIGGVVLLVVIFGSALWKMSSMK
jgi:hypothetical protein